MTRRWVEIRLKVPDNTAYTALVALRRLGVAVARVERARLVAAGGEAAAALDRVRRDEAIFNPNLHDASIIEREEPASGELWVWPREASHELQRWRLVDEFGAPASRALLEHARDALLCNPAIEEAELLA